MQKNAQSELKKLSEYSQFYKKMIHPEIGHQDKQIRERLARHNKWEIRTAYPFLLNVYKDFSDGKLLERQFCEVLDTIESFVIRRFFCKEPTHKLNRLFIGLYGQIDKKYFVESLKQRLIKDWPNDKRFKDGIKLFPIYKSGNDKCRLILDSLEMSFSHKEPVDLLAKDISIEHVMPKVDYNPEKLPKEWKSVLGKDYAAVHEAYVNTLANLTLTGYNSPLSTKPFEEKKKLLKDSHFELNKHFALTTKWDEQAILDRWDTISKKAVDIWKYLQN